MKGAEDELPVNVVEAMLADVIKKAGLPDPICQKEISLPKPFSSTWPDFFTKTPGKSPTAFASTSGLSKHIHGNAQTKQKDIAIRALLRERNYAVLELPASHLNDPDSLAAFLYALARKLVSKSQAHDVRNSRAWQSGT